MADLVFSIKTVTIGDVVDNITNWASRANIRDIGVTQGGATITMEATNLEINSDQNMDPEATVLTGYPKTITVNALDLVPANLALAFGGTVDGTNFTTTNYIGKGNIIMLPDGTSVKASAVTATQVTVTNLDGTTYTFGATASSQTITVTSDVVKMTY